MGNETSNIKTTKAISPVTIAALITAHKESDEKKFVSYANFLADAYEEAGNRRGAEIIRQSLNGTYKEVPKVIAD